MSDYYNANAGGHFIFGPTYNSTNFVRATIEGSLNGFHEINVEAAQAVNGELAGKIAAIGADGKVCLAGADGAGAIGLLREDVKDMVNASNNATFYFRGGEYHIAESRLGDTIDKFTLGGYVTTDANGALVPTTEASKAVGIVIDNGTYPMGNMYRWAGEEMNGGKFLGILLKL